MIHGIKVNKGATPPVIARNGATKQSSTMTNWIAAPLTRLAMTMRDRGLVRSAFFINLATRAFPPRGSAKGASIFCPRSAASVLIFSFFILLSGCLRDNVDGCLPAGGDAKAIVFSPTVDKTRAANESPIENGTNNIPDGASFGVYAYRSTNGTGSDLVRFNDLSNREVTRDDDEFTYSPVAKWPLVSTAKLSFFGYYPWTDQTATTPNPAVTMNSTSQQMAVTYTVPDDPAEHIDLMYARTALMGVTDPVSLDFGHALTWLRFTGAVEDYTGTVKITGIAVKDAVTKGTLAVLDPVTQTGKPAWTLAGDTADYEITSSNGLLDVALTGAMQPVVGAAGQMLVIPQPVAGLTLEVEATIDDVAFPEAFTFPLVYSPEWKMNEIITYEITICPDGMHVTANVNDWNTNNVSVIQDGQWWLSVTGDTFEFDAEGTETHTLTASTNYNIDTQGYPAGLQIDEAETEYTPAVASGDEWLTITGGANGDLSRTITLTATAMSAPGIRTAKVKVRAGNLTKIVNVTQSDPGIAPRFARSNIVWDGTKLTFAVTKEDNATIPADVQGLLFRWGSLFAISPVGTINAATSILHYPSDYTGTIPSGTAAAAMAGIPYLDDTTSPPFNDAVSADDDFRYYNGNVGYDVATGKGDICRYITAQKWVEGSWRMPTAGEFTTLFSEKTAVSYGTAGSTTIPSGSNSYGVYEHGYYNSLFGFLAGVLATAEDSSSVPAYGAFFPASGRRNGDSGGPGVSLANYFSYYWACSSGNDQAFSYASTSSPSTGAGSRHERHWPQAIRCIRDDGELLTPYTLTVDKDAATLAADGTESVTVNATTDYTGGDPYYPLAGLQIDAAEIVYDPAVASGDEWLTITGISNGAPSVTLTLTAAVNVGDTRTATVKIRGGNLCKTVTITQASGLPPVDPDVITGGGNATVTKSYAGAFWRADQRAERLIGIQIADAAYAGNWVVQVLDYGDFAEGDIVFDAWDGDLSTVNTTDPDDLATPLYVNSTRAYQTGTVANGGKIAFRIGLKQKWSEQAGYATKKVRYARVVVSFGTDMAYNRVIWLRQGEEPDVLFPDRPLAKAFSPYNLTSAFATDATTTVPVSAGGGTFTAYPSQAGAFWQWSGWDEVNARPAIYALSPVIPNTTDYNTDFSNTYQPVLWSQISSIYETCPQGYNGRNYRRPADGSIIANVNPVLGASSEFHQSLLSVPFDGMSSISSANLNAVWGYYADGFFDRRATGAQPYINTPTSGYTDTAVDVNKSTVAYVGNVFYNAATNASIFFPAAGCRVHPGTLYTGGHLTNPGNYGYYWSTASRMDLTAHLSYFTNANFGRSDLTKSSSASIRCVAD